MTNKQGETWIFEDLEIWQIERDLRNDVSNLVKIFPKSEEYSLVDQMNRVARSVTANVAEGYGRYHYKKYKVFPIS